MTHEPLELLEENTWSRAQSQAAAARALLDQPGRTRSDIEVVARTHGVSVATVYRWMRRLKSAEGRASGLLPGARGRRYGARRLPGAVEAILTSCLEVFWRTAERPRPSALTRMVMERCHKEGLPPPSDSTIRRRLRAAHAPLSQESSGRRKADPRRRRVVPGAFPEATGPLDVVQIDHTRVDVIAVDAQNRAPLGRPWLTLAIDVCTRAIPGFYLSMDAPSATSVGLCVAQIMTAKEGWLEARGLEIDWPMAGRPKMLHMDNAREFHSDALRRGCEEHGVALAFRPLGQPHFGGHIERLIGTMMGDVHLLPGTTFSSPQEKDRYDAEGKACLTLAELERWMALAIDLYHRRVHSALGGAPAGRWQALASDLAPVDCAAARLLLDFLPLERRRITKTGVRFLAIDYWSDALRPLAGGAERRIIRYDPRDLSRIWLLSPNGGYIDLPYRRRAHPPISLWEHRQAMKALKREGAREVDEGMLFERVAAMRAVVDEAVAQSKAARRTKARRPQSQLDEPASAPAPLAETKPFKPERLFDVEDW